MARGVVSWRERSKCRVSDVGLDCVRVSQPALFIFHAREWWYSFPFEAISLVLAYYRPSQNREPFAMHLLELHLPGLAFRKVLGTWPVPRGAHEYSEHACTNKVEVQKQGAPCITLVSWVDSRPWKILTRQLRARLFLSP